MDDSNKEAIMEKGQASAQPRNGVWEGEGKRNNRRLQSSVEVLALGGQPSWIVTTIVVTMRNNPNMPHIKFEILNTKS